MKTVQKHLHLLITIGIIVQLLLTSCDVSSPTQPTDPPEFTSSTVQLEDDVTYTVGGGWVTRTANKPVE